MVCTSLRLVLLSLRQFYLRCKGIGASAGIEDIDGAQNDGYLFIHTDFDYLMLLGIEKVGNRTQGPKHIFSRNPLERGRSESLFEDGAGEYPVRGSIGGNLLTG